MPFKETLETIHETEKEVQRFMTELKEHSYSSTKKTGEGRYIKAYKEELEIEKELKFLCDFLKGEKRETEEELKEFKQGVAKECLKMKCKQIDRRIEEEFSIEDEDFGEE